MIKFVSLGTSGTISIACNLFNSRPSKERAASCWHYVSFLYLNTTALRYFANLCRNNADIRCKAHRAVPE